MIKHKRAYTVFILFFTLFVFCACEEQYLKCGESADFDVVEITIDNPVKSLIQKNGENDYDALLKVPIRIDADDDLEFEASDFKTRVIEKENSFPETLLLRDGESYKGFLYIDWPSANKKGGPSSINEIIGEKDDYKCTWSFSYTPETKKCQKVKEMRKLLPDTKIKVKGTIMKVSDNGVVTFQCERKGTLYFKVPFEKRTKYKKHAKKSGDGNKVFIAGKLANIITEESNGEENVRPYLKKVKIVKVYKPKKKEHKKQNRSSSTRSNYNYNQVYVYVTPHGKKYHNSWCTYAKGAGVKEITLIEAQRRGLGQCSKCASYY